MPEGDTIHRLARRLVPALGGRPIARLWVRDRGEVPALCGATVIAVEAVG
ncbi:MAG: Fpg/Nei family DNA glycosylase, partial [Myxococcales bacterium]|nr:Fpg/Nei family DNA glycosylase [Myxococcales bacterium]